MRRSRILGLSLCLAVLTAGCVSSPAPQPSSTPTAADEPTTESGEPSHEDAPELVLAGTANALELTGPVVAQDVPDMEPLLSGLIPDLPTTLVDASGEQVTITSAERILSLDLYGTLTDTLIGLGLHDRLIGRANSDTQDALADLPVVTQGGHDLNVEAVLDLEPDLILTNTTIGTPGLYDQLEAAGVTVVRFEQIPALDNIQAEIELIGAALGVEEAANELAELTNDKLDDARAQIEQMRSATPHEPRGVILYVRGTAGVFFILGADYGAADVLQILGLEDVAQSNGITDLRPANTESLLTLDPEIILAMSEGVASTGGIDGLLQRPGVATTTAGTNQRIITANDTQLLSYGPRTPDNLLALAEAIYTDVASTMDEQGEG